ncbi:hypothetical protein CKO11_05735 [Rhodobacter sp. TJ_12]|nr:hypothetical protein [Rhodobacter sp. TJ_12]
MRSGGELGSGQNRSGSLGKAVAKPASCVICGPGQSLRQEIFTRIVQSVKMGLFIRRRLG